MTAVERGQTNEVAPALRDGTRVLYLGDYDLAGGDIEGNTRRVHALDWERLALTADEVSDYRLDADHQDGPAVQERRSA